MHSRGPLRATTSGILGDSVGRARYRFVGEGQAAVAVGADVE